MSGPALRWGFVALIALALFSVAVVGLASGPEHLANQARLDWYWLLAITLGFGVQVALLVEVRRRQRVHHAAAAAAGTGAAASAVGMVACCAHHLADLLPLLGATGAAAVLLDYRIPTMVLGIGVNAVGIIVAARRVCRLATVTAAGGGVRCTS